MKISTTLNSISRWTSFSAATLGSVALIFATPQMEPDGVIEISEFIQMEIYHDIMMKGSEVTVKIEDGIAILSGTTNSLAQAERAAAKAFTSPEVLTVLNRLKVFPQGEEAILSHANALLRSQEVIDSSRISLSTNGSHVVLEGQVSSVDEAELAREIASETPGATAIENNLVVDFKSVRTSDQIAAQLRYSINDDPLFTGLDISPQVKNGIVSWNGDVGSRDEFSRLIRVSYVTGVIDVNASEVIVNGDLAMEAVEDKEYTPTQTLEALNAAIEYDPVLKSQDISADLNQGVLTLKGYVENSAQSDAAELTARCIPGVRAVSNRLSSIKDNQVATNSAQANVVSAN